MPAPAEPDAGCCGPEPCCQVESIVTVDERGQMVLPKDVREKVGIEPRQKLAVVTWGVGTQAPFVALIPAEHLAAMTRGFLGPVFADLLAEEEGGRP